jgi:AraC-like DNA-binding protein/quercetin dioxygenase-like cupin family protein
MDGLSAVLDQIKLNSVVYFKSAFAPDWGMDVQQGPYAQFHIIAEGGCCFKCEGHETKELTAGDILIFPNGTAHWLAHTPGAPKINGHEVVSSVKQGKSVFASNHSATTIICGHFEFDKSVDHPFISSLPDIIHIQDIEEGGFAWILSIANLLVAETEEITTGSQSIVRRLAESLFISAIRYYVAQNHDQPFLAALYDQKISAVLQLIHACPEKMWSLNNLSKEAGMSRSSFANHFRNKVGQTPMHYLTHWRMLTAQRILEESDKSIAEVAELVGYGSEISFGRAFKKHLQQTPAGFRRLQEAA